MIDLSSSNNLLADIQSHATKDINFMWIGEQDYLSTWELQKQLHQDIKNNEMNDVLSKYKKLSKSLNIISLTPTLYKLKHKPNLI